MPCDSLSIDCPRAALLHHECRELIDARDLGIITGEEAREVIQRRWGMAAEPIRLPVRDVENATGESFPR